MLRWIELIATLGGTHASMSCWALEATRVFQFLDDGFIDADEDLVAAKDDLDRMSRLLFLREVIAVSWGIAGDVVDLCTALPERLLMRQAVSLRSGSVTGLTQQWESPHPVRWLPP
jgi:hypothetical protein